MDILSWIRQPWPWYVGGPLIGLTVPLLLLAGNKPFGISSSLKHICAACLPARVPFFQYDWKKESWNLFFAAGIVIGAFIAVSLLSDHQPVKVNAELAADWQAYGIHDYSSPVPKDLFNWPALGTARGLLLMVLGGLLVGFGTRYAGGCTSGHSIMGLSNLQWLSLVATICFMAGGFVVANLVVPYILQLH
ncbi:MAG: YeeE/YedE family protein [Bacteroidetes bacterium]|nr:YeeE/YedE family protein [Bacteroidota bacterium]